MKPTCKISGYLLLGFLLFQTAEISAQTTRSWSGATGGAWLTGTNWSPSGTFAGGAPLANPAGEGANTDIVAFVAANSATNVGINMNTLNAAGGVGLILGGIDFNKTNTATVQIGNSSTTVNGIMQINGATINSVANTLIRVAGSANLTIANVNSGSGTQTMGLQLGITNGIMDVGTSRTLTISSIVSQATAGSAITKTGAGTLVLSAANTFSGGVSHNAGIINISNASALGTGTFTFGGYNRLQINVADGASMNVANDMVLPLTGTGDEAELIRVGDGSPTAGTTARLTGVISGGNSGAIYSLDSDQGGNHNNTLVLENASNSFTGTLELWRGALAFTSDGALGNVSNTIRVNNAGFNGGLRFNADNITTASTRTFQLVGNEKIDTQAFTSTVNSAISGTGSLRKIGSGSLTFGGTNTYSGGTTNVAGGNLRLSGGAAIPDASAVTLDNTAGVGLELLANETVGSVAGGGTTGGNINLNANTLTLAAATATSFGGVISGTGGAITKTGNSVFTLTGSNTYTGGTNLNAGSVSISNGSGLGTGTVTIGTGATSGTGGSVSTILVNNTAATTVDNDIVLSAPGAATTYVLMKATASTTTGTQLNLTGDISGGNANHTFRLNSDTAGDTTTTYRLAGNNSFQGNLELYRGAIVVTNNNSLGSAKLLLNGNNNTTLGDLRFENSVTLANDIDLFNSSNPDPIHTNGNTVVLSGVISSTGDENLVKIGAGTLALSGANTYTVGTTISGGTLQIGNGGTTGSLSPSSVIANNATLAFNRSDTVTQGTHFSTAAITGTGALEQKGTGTLVLNAANTYSGGTTVSGGGGLEVANTTGSATGSGNVNVTGSGSTIFGSGTIVVANSGSVILGNNTRISVGKAGDPSGKKLVFTPVSGTMSTDIQSGATMEFDLFSGAGGGDNSTNAAAADLLQYGGTLTLGTGVKLRVGSSMSGFTANDKWRIFDWTTLAGSAPTGTFDSALLELPTLTGGLAWDLSSLYTSGTIVVVVPEPSRVLMLVFGLLGLVVRRRHD